MGRGRAVWVCTNEAVPQLLSLARIIENQAGSENVGGSHLPLFTDRDGNPTLLGRPLLFTEKMQPLGDLGDIAFVDFNEYLIGLRSDASISRSVDLGFMSDQTDFRIILRVDGRGSWSQPFTPRNGQTLSWCVSLAERA